MFIKDSYKRLLPGNFFSLIDKYHNEFICKYIEHGSVLDIGCGYGSLVNYLNQKKIAATGVDNDEYSIGIAKMLFPTNNYISGTLDESFEPRSFDYVILKDALHHIYEQNEFEEISACVKKVLKPGGKMIIFDPNVNFILKTARIISSHKDAECSFKDAVRLLNENKFKIIKIDFAELFGLPISGGYVGICFVPKIQFLQKLLLFFNKLLSNIISKIFLRKYLLWRYLIMAVVE